MFGSYIYISCAAIFFLIKDTNGSPIHLNTNMSGSTLDIVENAHHSNSSHPDAVPYPNWPPDGTSFPNPFRSQELCNYEITDVKKRWVCDPDKMLQLGQVVALSDKIQDILEKMPCQCSRAMGCTANLPPMGRYSIGIAIVKNIEGSGAEIEKVQSLSYNLRRSQWVDMKRCNDMLVIALSTDGKAIYYSPDPLVSVRMTSDCISEINDKTRKHFETGDWYAALNEALDYTRNALAGGRCGTKSGLSAGQIVGIVFGVISGVATIVGVVICCIGFCTGQDWAVGTCIGVCMGCILGAIQACINAMIFSCMQAIFAECGCEDCCDCEPIDCLPEDSIDAGGGMEY